MREIISLKVTMPETQVYSVELRAMWEMQLVSFTTGDHLMEIGFNEEGENNSAGFGPGLPLIMRW
jgi:hypothetical protein